MITHKEEVISFLDEDERSRSSWRRLSGARRGGLGYSGRSRTTEARAMWVHSSTGEVFAPYDGGVDVVFSSVERRDLHRQRFSAWLSSRPDGL